MVYAKNQKKMKKVLYLIVSSIFIFSGIGCTQKPNSLEIINLVKARYGNNFIIKIVVQSTGNSTKKDDVTFYPYTIRVNYIKPGLTYGYVSGCPERHCIEDTEFNGIQSFLVGKDQWDKWKIYDSKFISNEKIQTIWRPESKSMQEFYKNRIDEQPNHDSKSAEEIAVSLSSQIKDANDRVIDEWTRLTTLYKQRNQTAFLLIANIENSKIGSTFETKVLKSSLDKFNEINQSYELLTNNDLFDIFIKETEEISSNLIKVLSNVDKSSVNDDFLKIQTNLESSENRISIQRRIFNENAQQYNISFNKKIKVDNEVYMIFIKKFPNLGLKCYFKPKENAEPAPSVKF